jgi:hypothetical protein
MTKIKTMTVKSEEILSSRTEKGNDTTKQIKTFKHLGKNLYQ